MIWDETRNQSPTIDRLYNYAKKSNDTLFPLVTGYEFWDAYTTQAGYFDRYFFQKYRAFKVANDYSENADDATLLEDWKYIVQSHFAINSKRYSELYRVEVLAADAYDIVNNYDLHEAGTRTNTGTQRTDVGAQTQTDEFGSHTDTVSVGEHNDETVHGTRTDINATTVGQQTSNSTEKVSAFNSSSLQDVQGATINNAARQDSATLTVGQQTDSMSVGAHTDSTSVGAHTDTHATTARTDERTDNLTEKQTLHRYGNIGVQTPADVIGGHIDLWAAFRFYQMIFDELATDYLVLDVEYFSYGANGANSGGSGDDLTLLQAIRELSTQLAASTSTITSDIEDVRIDITDVHENVHDAESAIKEDIAVLSNKVDTDTSLIRSDITGVETDGY